MATHRTAPQRPTLSIEEKRLAVARLKRRIEELTAFDPQSVQKRFSDPNVKALEVAIAEALSVPFGHSTVEYKRFERATKLDHGPLVMQSEASWITARGGGYGQHDDIAEARSYAAEGKAEALVLLERAVRSLEEEIADQEHAAPLAMAALPPAVVENPSKVFVVHGHDEGVREAVARFIAALGFQPIILHERANEGRTVIEKVEAHGDVGFAVVLLTPDDEGCAKGEAPAPRARQNVVLELGYFIGRLGRNRVCALKRGEVEIPSDFGGVVYETFDASGGWKQALGRELEAVGFEIDWNKIMRS